MKMGKVKILIYTMAVIASVLTDRPYLCVGVVIGEILYEFFRGDS